MQATSTEQLSSIVQYSTKTILFNSAGMCTIQLSQTGQVITTRLPPKVQIKTYYNTIILGSKHSLQIDDNY